MIDLRLNNSTIKVAENWNELTKKQILSIVELLFGNNLKLTKQQWKYALLYKVLLKNELLNLKFIWLFTRLPKVDIISSLFPLVNWLEAGNTLTDFKLKSFRVGFTRFYAPKDGLINLTIDEFQFTDGFYIDYKKNKNIDYLDGLIAVLYRRKQAGYNPISPSYNGDIREVFNENTIVTNSKKASKLSLAKKHLILLAYEGSRNEIIENCPNLFSSKETQQKGKSFGYGGLILELSGDKFGNHLETKKTNLITAFNFLEMEAIKHAKNKDK